MMQANRIAPRDYKIEIVCGETVLGYSDGWSNLCPACKLKGEHQEGCTNKVTIDLGPKY